MFSVYAATSLITHNRRQKRAWIERELDRLRDAQVAFLKGDATAEQLHLLEQERAGEEMAAQHVAERERKKRAGLWASFKGVFVSDGDMGREEREAQEVRDGARGRLLEEGWVEGQIQSQAQSQRPSQSQIRKDMPEGFIPVAVEDSGIRGVGLDAKGRPVPMGKVMRAVVQNVEDERRTGEKEVMERTGITGGPLDVMAGNMVEKVKVSSSTRTDGDGGWMSWIRGSK